MYIVQLCTPILDQTWTPYILSGHKCSQTSVGLDTCGLFTKGYTAKVRKKAYSMLNFLDLNVSPLSNMFSLSHFLFPASHFSSHLSSHFWISPSSFDHLLFPLGRSEDSKLFNKIFTFSIQGLFIESKKMRMIKIRTFKDIEHIVVDN